MPNLQSNQINDGHGQTFSDGFNGDLKNCTVQNFVFVTKGLILGGSSNVIIQDCTFRDLTERGIDWYGGVSAVTVRRCQFLNVRADAACLGWNATNGCVFSDNVFDRCVSDAIHSFHGGDRSTPDNLVITRNVLKNQGHIGIECQGNPQGMDVSFNVIESWVPEDSHMALSIATGGDQNDINLSAPGMATSNRTAHNVKIHDNLLIAAGMRTGPPYKDTYAPIEAMGWSTAVYNNFIAGPWGCAVLYGLTSENWSFKNNVVMGSTDPGHPIKPEDRATAPKDGNVSGNRIVGAGTFSIPATADVLAGKCLWQSTGSGAPPVITPSTATPTMTIPDLKGAVTGPGAIAWTWAAIATPVHYRIQATHGTQVFAEGDLVPGASSVSISGVPSNWELTATLSANGAVLATNTTQYLDSLVLAPVVTLPPAPTLLRTIQVYSDGSVKVVEAGN